VGRGVVCGGVAVVFSLFEPNPVGDGESGGSMLCQLRDELQFSNVIYDE
jgi:hypothetical protein